MDNIIIDVLEKQEKERKAQAMQSEWSLTNVRRLTEVLEKAGATVSSHLWDLFCFNINGLRINQDGKVCYLSFYKPSKRILNIFARYNNVIVENFDYITSGGLKNEKHI